MVILVATLTVPRAARSAGFAAVRGAASTYWRTWVAHSKYTNHKYNIRVLFYSGATRCASRATTLSVQAYELSRQFTVLIAFTDRSAPARALQSSGCCMPFELLGALS